MSSRKLYNSERENSLLKLNKKEVAHIKQTANMKRLANYSVTTNEEVKLGLYKMKRDQSS